MSLFNYFSICETYCTLSAKLIVPYLSSNTCICVYFLRDIRTPLVQVYCPTQGAFCLLSVFTGSAQGWPVVKVWLSDFSVFPLGSEHRYIRPLQAPFKPSAQQEGLITNLLSIKPQNLARTLPVPRLTLITFTDSSGCGFFKKMDPFSSKTYSLLNGIGD